MNSPSSIYLDNNSTTPIHPEVAETMLRAAVNLVGNPASQHSLGRKTRRVLEEAREGIVSLLGGKTGGMDADRLIFTSGGTEANQLAIRGLVVSAVSNLKFGLRWIAAEHRHLFPRASQRARRRGGPRCRRI
jgi:cysteine desulfurase